MIKVNLLAVSVGNTRTRVGAFVEGNLIDTATLENQKIRELGESLDHAFTPLREREETVILLSSVNPPAATALERQISDQLQHKVLRVERDLPVPVGRQLDREALVGEDRLLNCAAAYDVLKQACVVVDAGTAITVDFVDGAGTFHGGAISPGAQLQLDALTQRTALLPEVEFGPPVEAIGHNTVEAMKAGVFHGMRGMVRELVEQFAEQVGHYPMVVATGGDANVLFRDYPLIDRVVPDLTLMGLAVTLRTVLDSQQ